MSTQSDCSASPVTAPPLPGPPGELVTAVSGASVPAAPRRTPRLAANPIAYWLRDGHVDKSPAVLEAAFADLSAIGFAAVKADVPVGMTAEDYARWIDGFGLSASLSLFSSAFDETIDIADEMERARRFAAEQVALGLDRTMVSSLAVSVRMAEPGVGADFDKDRLALAIENCGVICEVLQSHGLRPLHHSHVGGVFETESEITALLDTLGPDVLGFGPDTGHLAWAGADLARLIRRYADRIGGIHLKDCFPDHLDAATRHGGSYQEVVATKRLWAEPGLGVVDFAAVLAAMPEDYEGDFMIEVDVPSLDSRRLSLQMCFDWATRVLPLPKL